MRNKLVNHKCWNCQTQFSSITSLHEHKLTCYNTSTKNNNNNNNNKKNNFKENNLKKCYDCQVFVPDLKAHRKECPNSRFAHSFITSSLPIIPSPSSLLLFNPNEMNNKTGMNNYIKNNNNKNNNFNINLNNNNNNNNNMSVTQFDHHQEKEYQPIDFYFVMDVSGSMLGNRLTLAKETVSNLTNQLNENDRIAIVTFDTSAFFKLKPHPAGKIKRKNELPEILNRIFARGGTALYDAICLSLSQVIDKSKRLVMFVLTDGDDNSSKNSFQSTLNLLTEFTNVSLVIIQIRDGLNQRLEHYENLCCARGEYVLVQETNIVLEVQNLFTKYYYDM